MTWCSTQNRERSKAGRKPRLRGRLYTKGDVPSNLGKLPSGGPFELTLLGNALVRLARALDAVLLLVAFGRENADHLIDATDIAAADQTRNDMNVVADAELVSQDILRYAKKASEPPQPRRYAPFVMRSMSLQ